MSVLIAIKDNDRVVIGCDTRMSNDHSYNDSYEDRPKGIKLDNGIVVAATGNIGLLDIFAKQLKDFDSKKDLTHDYVLFKVLFPIVKEYQGKILIRDNEMDADLMIAKGDKCFIVFGNCTIEELHNYRAIGTGEMVALGSLFSTFGSSMSVEERILTAIKASGAVVPSVSSECWIADTKSKNFKQY